MTRRGLLAAAGAGAATLALPGVLRAAEMKDYILATANTGGTFYPIGVAVATLTQLKLANQKGIRLNAINSAGSGENINLLSRNEAQFALMQSVFGYSLPPPGRGRPHRWGPRRTCGQSR